MLDQLTSENSRDFNSRYANTFGWLIANEAKRLVHITDVTSDEVFFRTTHKGLDHHVRRDSGVEFEFTQLERGFYLGTDNCIYFMQRVPARQWKRGICRQNTSLSVLRDGTWTSENINVDKLRCVLGGSASFEDNGEKSNFILSKYFAVSGQQVWFMTNKIGDVRDSAIISLNDFGVFVKQELQDAINRTGRNAWLRLTN